MLEGRQAYWVCPLIEESEELRYQAAEETAAALAEALPEVRVGLVHGRMPPREKERGMYAFKEGKIGLLVATTVIEVGVDVPNATLMVIENAERMGLAQLHQLRGRVGRGAHESHCVLLYGGKFSEMARTRLAAIRETNDGFVIARRDLELRGPGEMLGTRQTGLGGDAGGRSRAGLGSAAGGPVGRRNAVEAKSRSGAGTYASLGGHRGALRPHRIARPSELWP